jgi:hypothetical protein
MKKDRSLSSLSKPSKTLLSATLGAAKHFALEGETGAKKSDLTKALKEYERTKAKLAKHISKLENKANYTPKSKAGKTRPIWYLKVKSSNIKKAAFHFKKQQLMIHFVNGTRYVYKNVNMYEWLAFSEADSQGKWFIENIRDQKPTKKLD